MDLKWTNRRREDKDGIEWGEHTTNLHYWPKHIYRMVANSRYRLRLRDSQSVTSSSPHRTAIKDLLPAVRQRRRSCHCYRCVRDDDRWHYRRYRVVHRAALITFSIIPHLVYRMCDDVVDCSVCWPHSQLNSTPWERTAARQLLWPTRWRAMALAMAAITTICWPNWNGRQRCSCHRIAIYRIAGCSPLLSSDALHCCQLNEPMPVSAASILLSRYS